jgi:hypothetical protein
MLDSVGEGAAARSISRAHVQHAGDEAVSSHRARFYATTGLPDLHCEHIPVEKAVALSGAQSFKHARSAVKRGRVCIRDMRASVDDSNASEDSIDSPCTLGLLVASNSTLTLDGRVLPPREPIVYYLLNKHRQCMSVAQDGPFRKSAEGGTVLDYVPSFPRVFPVGRLDYDSEGTSDVYTNVWCVCVLCVCVCVCVCVCLSLSLSLSLSFSLFLSLSLSLSLHACMYTYKAQFC